MSEQSFRIVVGIDFSEQAQQALERAFVEAHLRGRAEIHLVSVIHHDPSEVQGAQPHERLVDASDRLRERIRQAGAAALAAFAARYPKDAVKLALSHARVGNVAQHITGLAAEIAADLVIVGTHGRKGMRRLMMGSVAEKVVRLAPCPVLVVREKDAHALDGLPAIEPPCRDCMARREKTAGASWWCATHEKAPIEIHTYSHSERFDQPPSAAPFGSR